VSNLLEKRSRLDVATRIDGFGWWPWPASNPAPEERRRATEHARREYCLAFDGYHVTALADLALRELLDLCRREQISAALFLMPEGSSFRSWYPPAAHEEINAYLDRLCRLYDIHVYNTTTWCVDGDFVDGHHLLCEPAVRFSERFGRDVVRSWLSRAAETSQWARLPASR
jgi:hypothetical protein